MDVFSSARIENVGAGLGSSGSAQLQNPLRLQPEGASFSETLTSALDSLSGALEKADSLAAAVPEKKADIADASIARAKADVMLEVAAITASRISGALSQLMQTQL